MSLTKEERDIYDRILEIGKSKETVTIKACPRCGQIAPVFTLSFQAPSNRKDIYEMCDFCYHDLVRFIEKIPLYNEHGYNLKEWEQRRECNEGLFFRGDLLKFQLENLDTIDEDAERHKGRAKHEND